MAHLAAQPATSFEGAVLISVGMIGAIVSRRKVLDPGMQFTGKQLMSRVDKVGTAPPAQRTPAVVVVHGILADLHALIVVERTVVDRAACALALPSTAPLITIASWGLGAISAEF